METYELTRRIEEAENGLSELRDVLYGVEEAGEVDEDDAASAILALSAAFDVVKALAEAGGPIFLPTGPLPLSDAALLTILQNAAITERKLRQDVEWAAGVMERVRGGD